MCSAGILTVKTSEWLCGEGICPPHKCSPLSVLSLLKSTVLGAAIDDPQSPVTSHSRNLFLVLVLGWPRSVGVRRALCSMPSLNKIPKSSPHHVRFVSTLYLADSSCGGADLCLAGCLTPLISNQ